MHRYRTHTCGELRQRHAGQTIRLSGWIHRRRDHGGVLFLDLRDHYGITQLVISPEDDAATTAAKVPRESVIRVVGDVRERSPAAINSAMKTGEIEIAVRELEVLSPAEPLPFSVAEEPEVGESTRLSYRFLDLRRAGLHRRIQLRSDVIASIRRRMTDMGFAEFQTPILTSSSPEGARDYLVPSRLYPGQFYALPQAPQQFKQLLMVSGFDRYFQIAPCFRDEDARADRSPGEFYQLDLEIAFVEQEDVFAVVEELFSGLFCEFTDWAVTAPPFPRLSHADAMLRFGTDKPDLRFALEIQDLSEIFAESSFRLFRDIVAAGGVVRALCVPELEAQPRSFFDGLETFVKEAGGKGLAYLINGAQATGSIAAALEQSVRSRIIEECAAAPGSAIFFIAGPPAEAAALAGRLRLHLADRLDLRREGCYEFCWVVDFPMYEWDEERACVAFSHNPFSMPQGGMAALEDAIAAGDKSISVRHRLQRPRTVERCHPQSQTRHHVQGVRDSRALAAGSGSQVRGHDPRLALRRSAPRRHRTRHRPYRHAAGGRTEHTGGHRLPDEPECAGPAHGRSGRRCRLSSCGSCT